MKYQLLCYKCLKEIGGGERSQFCTISEEEHAYCCDECGDGELIGDLKNISGGKLLQKIKKLKKIFV